MIIERTHYFSKPGRHDATLAVRRDACNVRVAIGLPAGTIRVKADPSADGPDVAWECAFANRASHAADLAARAASPEFEAVRACMRETIERFERLFEERVAGAGGWAGDIDVAALNYAPEVHAFPSGAHQLKGFLFKPPGDGPFPCMVYNHGSGVVDGHEDNATPGIAILLNSWGIACFMPHRRGYGFSTGPTWLSECSAPAFSDEYNAQLVHRLAAECDDVLAAFSHVGSLPGIDGARIGVMGSSFGGVNTLLAAAREPRLRCAVEFAGAAMNWDRNPVIAAHMVAAAKKVTMPIYFVQAANDFSIRPTEDIARALQGSSVPYQAKIYPPFGHTHYEGHALAGRGSQIWGPEIRHFLERYL
ncbi:MAG: dienelactone hydrolase family protein [Burkholderiaceae bacterium]